LGYIILSRARCESAAIQHNRGYHIPNQRDTYLYTIKEIAMNPYYYLFYKLSCLLNSKGNNEWGPIAGVTLFVGLNSIVIYGVIFNITEKNSQGPYKTTFIFISIALFITNSFLFLNKQRVKKIVNRYKGESRKSRKIGNVLVILYVVLTLGLIILI
jgi:hypothetical protein